jgi:hypothetical protein
VNATLRGRPIERLAHLLAAAALFALLAPTAGLLVDAQLAGWSSNHGHAGRVSALATHSHPYDDHHAVGADGQTTNDAQVLKSNFLEKLCLASWSCCWG